MGKGEKSIFHNLRVLLRRCWSFTSFRSRIFLISAVSIILFISNSLHNQHKDIRHGNHIESLTLLRDIASNKRIACLVVGDSGVSESSINKEMYYNAIQQLFEMLATYDKYLHSYCDIKIFLVNTSVSRYYYNATQIANKLTHSEITFIPNTKLRFWQKRRFHSVYTLSYTYKHFLNEYEWYLKFHDTTHLVLVDNFEKLVFDENNLNKFDMTKSQILGHYIQYDQCTDFIYGLSLYAMNNEFIKQIGVLAYKQVTNNEVIVADIIECHSSNCEHHSENDFGAFCLDDLNINIGPIRDEVEAEYFLIFQIKDHYFRMNEWRDNDWYWIGKNKQSVADKCCAEYPVTFSNYRKPKIAKYYQQIYSQNQEDRNIKFMATNLK